MAQQLPRYQRPASLIQSPDVTGTNISALVQAEAQKTQAITSALDKLIGYAIDVGEKKEKKQKELLELEAISEFPVYTFKIQNHLTDIDNQIENGKIKSEEELNKEFLRVRNFIGPVFKKSEKIWNKLTTDIDNYQQTLSKSLNNKIFDEGKANSLNQFTETKNNYIKRFNTHLKVQSDSEESVQEILNIKQSLRTFLEVDPFSRNVPGLIDERLREFDEEIKNNIMAYFIEIGGNKDLFPNELSVFNRSVDNNFVFTNNVGDKVKDLNSLWNMLDEATQNTISKELGNVVSNRIKAEEAAEVKEEKERSDKFIETATKLVAAKSKPDVDLNEIKNLESTLNSLALTTEEINKYNELDQQGIKFNEPVKLIIEQEILIGQIQNKTQLYDAVLKYEVGTNYYEELSNKFDKVTKDEPYKQAERYIMQEAGMLEGVFLKSTSDVKYQDKIAYQKEFDTLVRNAEKEQAATPLEEQTVIDYMDLAIKAVAKAKEKQEDGLTDKQKLSRESLVKRQDILIDNEVTFDIVNFNGKEDELRTTLKRFADKNKVRIFNETNINDIVEKWKVYKGIQ